MRLSRSADFRARACQLLSRQLFSHTMKQFPAASTRWRIVYLCVRARACVCPVCVCVSGVCACVCVW